METTEQNISTTAPANPNPNTSLKNFRSLKGYALALTAVVVIVVGAVLFYSHFHIGKVYNYSKSNTFSITGTDSHGLSFSGPAQLQQKTKTASEISLQQTWVSGQNEGVTIATAAAQPFGTHINAGQLSAIVAALDSPNNSAYKTSAASAEQFTKARMTSSWTTTIGSAKKYTSPNIKAAAWTFDFTATDGQNKMRGRTLYMLTNNHAYYLMLASGASNWQSNSSEWQKIFASLKTV